MAPRAQAVRALRQWIEEGVFAVGERLPAEETLAKKLGVSRPTVRAALEELESLGWLKHHERRGHIVVTAEPPGNSVLSDTVAILTEVPNQSLAPWQRQRGWGAVVQQGAVAAINSAGLHALALHPDRLGEDRLRQFIAERPVGVIAMRPSDSSENMQTLVALRDGGIPVVVHGDVRTTQGFDSVSSDHEAGSYALTRWLIDQGRRRILRLWAILPDASARPVWLAKRDAGYERAMREAGLEILPPQEFRGITGRAITQTADEFHVSTRLMIGYLWSHLTGQRPVDAIMTATDGQIYATAAACRHLGKQPGQDVLLAGYDNYWSDSPERQWESSIPAVTVDKLNVDIGRAMVELLLARRQAAPGTPPMHRLIEPKLVVVGDER